MPTRDQLTKHSPSPAMTVVQGLNKLMKGADGLVKKGLKVVPT
jgi:hypothetical protein